MQFLTLLLLPTASNVFIKLSILEMVSVCLESEALIFPVPGLAEFFANSMESWKGSRLMELRSDY